MCVVNTLCSFFTIYIIYIILQHRSLQSCYLYNLYKLWIQPVTRGYEEQVTGATTVLKYNSYHLCDSFRIIQVFNLSVCPVLNHPKLLKVYIIIPRFNWLLADYYRMISLLLDLIFLFTNCADSAYKVTCRSVLKFIVFITIYIVTLK